MAHPQIHGFPTPPTSTIASPTPSNASVSGRPSSLPTPRTHRLQPGSQKEIALINYLDRQILKITRRYAKKFSNEGIQNDDTPGYTTYDQFVTDADPLLDVVWVSGTPTIQIPYLLQLAVLACSYLQAFPFSTSFFPVVSKIDQAFAAILQPSQNNSQDPTTLYKVNMTEKVRIKSLVEETRITAVNAASSSGHAASVQDVSEIDSDDEDEEKDEEEDEDDLDNMSISMALSKVYKRTLEILGDSLVQTLQPQTQDDDVPMT